MSKIAAEDFLFLFQTMSIQYYQHQNPKVLTIFEFEALYIICSLIIVHCYSTAQPFILPITLLLQLIEFPQNYHSILTSYMHPSEGSEDPRAHDKPPPSQATRLHKGYSKQQKLQILDSLGFKFDPLNQSQDKQEIANILFNIVGFPSIEKARIHARSNRLGGSDRYQQIDNPTSTYNQQSQYPHTSIPKQFCQCCGNPVDSVQLDLSTSVSQIRNLEESHKKYFQMVKKIIMLMAIATVLYSFSSLAISSVNHRNCSYNLFKCFTLYPNYSVEEITLFTDLQQRLYLLKQWLGFVMCLALSVFFLIFYYQQIKAQHFLNLKNPTPSSFTVMIENLPIQINPQRHLPDIIRSFYKTLNQKQPCQIDVEDVNTAEPLYFQQQDSKDERFQEMRQVYAQKIMKLQQELIYRIQKESTGFRIREDTRQILYDSIEKLKKRAKERSQGIAKILRQKLDERISKKTHNTVFLTLSNLMVAKMTRKYRKELTQYINKWRQSDSNPAQLVRIRRAPEPQDILWTNFGYPYNKIRDKNILTLVLLTLVVLANLTIVYAMTRTDFFQDKDYWDLLALFILNYITNSFISALSRKMTKYQRHLTISAYTVSFIRKGVIFQTIHSILSVLIFTSVQRGQLQHIDVLQIAEDLLYLVVTQVVLQCLIQVLDYQHIKRKIYRTIFEASPVKLIGKTQTELNRIYSGTEFALGIKYICLIRVCLFVFFYLSYQPLLAVFSILVMVSTFWFQKWVLFRRSARPNNSCDLVYRKLFPILYICPFLFGLGRIAFSFSSDTFSSPTTQYLPTYLSILLSASLYIFPFSKAFQKVIDYSAYSNIRFQDFRTKFKSEYSRNNPITTRQACRQFSLYIDTCESLMRNMFEKTHLEKNKIIQDLHYLKENVSRAISRYSQKAAPQSDSEANLLPGYQKLGSLVLPLNTDCNPIKVATVIIHEESQKSESLEKCLSSCQGDNNQQEKSSVRGLVQSESVKESRAHFPVEECQFNTGFKNLDAIISHIQNP